jgi:HAD superfamily hydrolase (TIGR01662 family)
MSKDFEAIFFDLGDTLMYFDDDWPEIFSRARQELLRSLQLAGIELGPEFLEDFYQRMSAYYRERDTEFIEYTIKNVLKNTLEERGFPAVPEATLTNSLADMHLITQAHWIPEDDALSTLAKLREQGYRLALISNAADDPNTQVLVDKLGAREYFEVIISSAALGIRKPNPRIFIDVLNRMSLPPEKVVMVGDTLGADILGAQNAGIFSIWDKRRANTAGNRALAETIFPDAQIETLCELPKLLEGLAAGYTY